MVNVRTVRFSINSCDVKLMAKSRHKLWTLLFEDDQVIIADPEDNLQKVAHKLNQIMTEYGLTISVQKTKSLAFKRRDQVRIKIVIDKKL